MDQNKMDSVIEKIFKLMSLSTSSNENEANLASTKARELLIKYNLEMSDVKDPKNSYETIDVDTDSYKVDKLNIFVNDILNKYFFVKVILSPGSLRTKKAAKFTIIGKKVNVKVAEHVRIFLIRTFNELYIDFKKGKPYSSGLKNSFYSGVHSGLCKHLESLNRAEIGTSALIISEEQNLKAYMNDLFKGDLKNRAEKNSIKDRDAYAKGSSEGANIRIRKAVDTKADNILRLR